MLLEHGAFLSPLRQPLPRELLAVFSAFKYFSDLVLWFTNWVSLCGSSQKLLFQAFLEHASEPFILSEFTSIQGLLHRQTHSGFIQHIWFHPELPSPIAERNQHANHLVMSFFFKRPLCLIPLFTNELKPYKNNPSNQGYKLNKLPSHWPTAGCWVLSSQGVNPHAFHPNDLWQMDATGIHAFGNFKSARVYVASLSSFIYTTAQTQGPAPAAQTRVCLSCLQTQTDCFLYNGSSEIDEKRQWSWLCI